MFHIRALSLFFKFLSVMSLQQFPRIHDVQQTQVELQCQGYAEWALSPDQIVLERGGSHKSILTLNMK